MQITREQILSLRRCMRKDSTYIIEQMFPSEFMPWHSRYSIGHIYKEKSSLGNGHRFLFVKAISGDTVSGYGIDGMGNWFNDSAYQFGNFELASDDEWMEQLQLQAIKKGYKIGARFETIDYHDSKMVEIASERLSITKKDIHLRTTEASLAYRDIYSNGVWAEIEESITLKQAEERLRIRIIG